MKKWIIREDKNIADILIEVYGKGELDLFQNVLQAFSSIITDLIKIKPKERITFKIKEDSFSSLVFNFIERLIFLKDTKGLIFKEGEFELKGDKNFILKTTLIGEKISQNLPIKIDIKALTYHKFKVEKKKSYYKATLVFDI